MAAWFDTLIKAVVYVTLLLELYLLWLILRKTPERMASFRFSLLLLIFNELCFTVTVGILMDPVVIFPVPGAAITGPLRYLGSECTPYWFALAIFFGAGAFWNQIYCLIFRYTAIQQSFHNLNKKFNRWPVRLIFSVFGLFVMVVCAYFSFPIMAPTDVTFLEIDFWVENQKPITPEDIAELIKQNDTALLLISFNRAAASDGKMFAIVVLGGFGLASILSIGFSVSIYRTIQANASHFTAQTYKLHRQLTKLLIIQFSSPMLFLAVPVVNSIVNAFFGNQEDKWVGDVHLLLLCLYTLVNSVVTLVFVNPYRNYTLQLLRASVKCGLPGSTRSSVVVPLQQQGPHGALQTTRVMS